MLRYAALRNPATTGAQPSQCSGTTSVGVSSPPEVGAPALSLSLGGGGGRSVIVPVVGAPTKTSACACSTPDMLVRPLTTAHASVQTTYTPPSEHSERLKERLASLELQRESIHKIEQERRLVRERDESAAPQLEEARAALAREQQVTSELRAQLEAARQAEAARAEECVAALSALEEARKQLSTRASECSHWRAEAARTVGRLETLTDFCERQTTALRAHEADAATYREQLDAEHRRREMQKNALRASEDARADQAAALWPPGTRNP
jgi:hypothetical protein